MNRIAQYSHDGLTFDVSDHGPIDGRVVILLHGFPEDRFSWDPLTGSLVGAGYRVLAADQRGYSPAARPAGRRSFTLDRLAGDALALAEVAGAARFDVVGHDWGASLAWHLAGHFPERVRSLSALSVPHARALLEAMVTSRQALHSWYVLFLQLPWAPEILLRRVGERHLVTRLRRSGLGEKAATRYAARVASPATATGPINWYRAVPLEILDELGPVATPTLFVWGDRDPFVTRTAAEKCARYVTGPYRYVTLPGATHWLPDESAGEVTPPLLDHLASIPA
jgi:pimeloyl-ACP methyl ester carboxylesterase